MTTCANCRSDKEEGRRCLNCKRNDYHRRCGATIDACKDCGIARPLAANGACWPCLKAAGLRQCSGACGEVKLQLLEFQNRQGVCRSCRRELKRLARAGGSGRRRSG